jgi:hypothetical protein
MVVVDQAYFPQIKPPIGERGWLNIDSIDESLRRGHWDRIFVS